MTSTELEFCDNYERKCTELELLTILKDELTPTGKATYDKISDWLEKNSERYIQLTAR